MAGTGSRNKRKRSRTRRAAESGFGLLLLGKNLLMAGVALLLLAGGVWASWDTAQHVMLTEGRERGTMAVQRCTSDRCTGPFEPDEATGSDRLRVSIDKAVARPEGESLPVAVKPGTDEVVRTGFAGVLYAWIPLAGSLLLAALVVAGGLRMPRTAWTVGLSGGVLLAAAFVAL
ncbi:hypothetical protein [Streptomyces sp. TP-A0874]|uniref:hypothetical protein n=1 Tax=Streptomyces sp. TP-A0874 TaxID=549819 RepID=UPI000852B604|nr:hypothetical protein [Streptomyces sp. TP-A0874]